MNRNQLLNHLKNNTRVLENPLIEEAFKAIDRKDFVWGDYENEAYEDYPLPIGEGQTISQPTTVAFMLEKLDPKAGEKILDVGSGSGWTTALLAHIVGDSGAVYGVERLPKIVAYGQKNLAKYDFQHVSIEQAGKTFGIPHKAPFDRILVSAAADKLPKELLAQLKEGGTIVIPVRDEIWKVVKKGDGKIEKEVYEGFAFVPLIEQSA